MSNQPHMKYWQYRSLVLKFYQVIAPSLPGFAVPQTVTATKIKSYMWPDSDQDPTSVLNRSKLGI